MKRSATIAAFVGLTFCCTEQSALAHRLDEYLQATLISIQTNAIHVELCLTPGVNVATQVIAQLDLDSNDLISTNEARSYAEEVRSSLTVCLNNRSIPLQVAGVNIPELEELRSGDAIIRMDFSSPLSALSPGTNSLAFTNAHQPALGIYLLNTAHPVSPVIQVRNQLRNATQSGGEIIFTYNPPHSESTTVGWLICGGAFLGGIAVSFWRARRQNGH